MKIGSDRIGSIAAAAGALGKEFTRAQARLRRQDPLERLGFIADAALHQSIAALVVVKRLRVVTTILQRLAQSKAQVQLVGN